MKIERGKIMEKKKNYEQSFHELVDLASGKEKPKIQFDGIGPTRSLGFCIFCDEERKCFSWVPERMNQSLPVCQKCFAKLVNAFGRVRGGLCCEDNET
jgi:predicted methyltransferase